jgi:LysM repeat protein
MSNKRRNRRTAKAARQGFLGRARAQMKLSANLTEEQDWYLDTPDVRLTRIFAVVILLHAIAVGGIFAFKMVDKASAASGVTISSAREEMEVAVQRARETAARVPATPVAQPLNEAPARQAPPAPLRRDPSKGDQYKVQAGDTLPEIAKALGTSPEALRAKNSILSDNELYPGRWLMIPGAGEGAPAPAATPVATPVAETPAAPAAPKAPASSAAASNPSEYSVKAGDTPWAIARQFNVPFNKLMSANGISNAQSLQIGQKLRIPSAN